MVDIYVLYMLIGGYLEGKSRIVRFITPDVKDRS
jgi:hypothetical protein